MHVILFDIDGTLIRGEGMGSLALKRTFEDLFGVEAVDREELKRIPFNGRSDPAIIADMAEALGVGAAYTESRDRFQDVYLGHLRITVGESRTKRMLPGAESLVHRLHDDARAQLGLLTGNVEAGARIKLAPFDLNRFFPFGGFGDDGPVRAKLAENAHRRAEAHLEASVAPDRVLVIGDTANDVAAGRAHGFATVAVETGGVDPATLHAAEPDAVFATLDDGFPDWLERRLAAS